MPGTPGKRWIALTVGASLLAAPLVALPFLRDIEQEELTPEVRARAPGQFVRLSQGITHYEVGGPAGGQPVVLVHGFSAPCYVWDLTFGELTRAGFRVIRYDLYGRGYSDRPAGPYDSGFFEQQLRELLTALQVEQPVDLVGHSMGGALGAAFTAHHPELVRKLVLIDPYTVARSVIPFSWPLVGEYINRVVLVPSLPGMQAADFSDPDRAPDWGARYREQMRYRGFGHAILSTIRHFLRYDALPYFRAVGEQSRPVLLIWGEDDRSVPVRQSVHAREALGQAEVVLVSGAGHAPHVERPDEVHPTLIDFLRR